MKDWAEYLEKVFDKVQPVTLQELYFQDDDPIVLQAQKNWQSKYEAQLAKQDGKLDTDGETWPACFKQHMTMREKFAKALAVEPPSVEQLRDEAVQKSKSKGPRFNWTACLPVREVDLLQIHLLAYLLPAMALHLSSRPFHIATCSFQPVGTPSNHVQFIPNGPCVVFVFRCSWPHD